MIINDKLLADLFLESHCKLALKSITTLNNHNCFLVVRRDSEMKILKVNNEKLSNQNPPDVLRNFLSFQVRDIDFNSVEGLGYTKYIIYGDLFLECSYFKRQPRRPNEYTLTVILKRWTKNYLTTYF